ncbi:AcrR family transcriptional regulator [Bacillus pakistanensis]|uniref:AcrR family transcriptional regulator n=1 Tax=Rossellomorea pakistanensis TaxID=992288 RepID=A0ABS2NHN4_9BACI|nr:TetR/AcrR family transcriptional regulator [Bacillus pakistanensis]MBM7587376.1 AcrR family transcriptional regulator [Bacillus pakistanensis]
MNKKQRDVLEHAHKLFIEKGYLDTSIQDILERCGISKGTFYKYFSSKSELLISLLSVLQESMTLQREKVAIEHKETNRLVFEEQMIFMMRFMEENKVPEMIETTLVLNEIKIYHYIEELKATTLSWIFTRFQQIFPNESSSQLFDSAVVFDGMLNNIFRINKTLNYTLTIEHIVRYCMKRTEEMIMAVSEKKEQLFDPELLFSLFEEQTDHHFSTELIRATKSMKRFVGKNVIDETKQKECLEFIEFISDELLQNNADPRNFIIKSSLSSLERIEPIKNSIEIAKYKQLINRFITNL